MMKKLKRVGVERITSFVMTVFVMVLIVLVSTIPSLTLKMFLLAPIGALNFGFIDIAVKTILDEIIEE